MVDKQERLQRKLHSHSTYPTSRSGQLKLKTSRNKWDVLLFSELCGSTLRDETKNVEQLIADIKAQKIPHTVAMQRMSEKVQRFINIGEKPFTDKLRTLSQTHASTKQTDLTGAEEETHTTNKNELFAVMQSFCSDLEYKITGILVPTYNAYNDFTEHDIKYELYHANKNNRQKYSEHLRHLKMDVYQIWIFLDRTPIHPKIQKMREEMTPLIEAFKHYAKTLYRALDELHLFLGQEMRQQNNNNSENQKALTIIEKAPVSLIEGLRSQ